MQTYTAVVGVKLRQPLEGPEEAKVIGYYQTFVVQAFSPPDALQRVVAVIDDGEVFDSEIDTVITGSGASVPEAKSGRAYFEEEGDSSLWRRIQGWWRS